MQRHSQRRWCPSAVFLATAAAAFTMALGDNSEDLGSFSNQPGCDSNAVGDEQLNQCLRFCADDDGARNLDDSFIVTSGSGLYRGSSCSEVTIKMSKWNIKEDVVDFCNRAQLTNPDGESESIPAKRACCVCGGGVSDNLLAMTIIYFVGIFGCVIFSCCFLRAASDRDVEYRTGLRIFGFTMFAMLDWITDFGFVYGSLQDSAFSQTYDADGLDDIRIAAQIFLWCSLVPVGAHLYFTFQDDPVKSNKQATMLCTCEFIFEDFPMLVMQAQYFMYAGFNGEDSFAIGALSFTVVKVFIQVIAIVAMAFSEDARFELCWEDDPNWTPEDRTSDSEL